jgi:hypothetical protein
MTDDERRRTDDEDTGNRVPTFSESLAAAAKQSGLGQLKPGETPSARSLLGAVGGIRGIIESVLPGIAFLLLFLATGNRLLSVLVPVVIAVVFIVARIIGRSPFTSAIAGAVLLAFSAILTLTTNHAVNNFVPGIVINVVCLVVLLVSLIARWALIGVFVGVLYGDLTGWRSEPPRRRILTIATWLWVGLFAIRLVLEVPLYFANNVAALGIVRLITSVPLYALVLWITWILVRGVYAGEKILGDDDAKNADDTMVDPPA